MRRLDIFIHPTAIVKTKKIGNGTHIGPYCYVSERVEIGKNCKLVGHVSIGTPAEYKKPPYEHGNSVVIGDNVEIREFVTINAPIGDVTKIGSRCYFMTKSHVGHDAILGEDVVLTTGAIIGGHSILGDNVYLGLNSVTHPWAELGDFSLVGASSFFKGKSPKAVIWVGSPAVPIKANTVGLERAELSGNIIREISEEANIFIKGWNDERRS
jgi:UDP-N-acetylglucosamine acyltransferase